MFTQTTVFLLATIAFVAITAVPLYDPIEDDQSYLPEEVYEYDVHRFRRSLQPGAPGFPQPSQQNGGWAVNPDLGRDENGNTRGQIEVNHKGKDHDFNAGWGKVIRGPNKAKPTWHVGGTIRW